MGNSASSGRGHHEEMVDFGYLTPQGIYTGPRDWNQGAVTQFIVERKLAPFYRPLEDYVESWDDEQILAARKEMPDTDGAESSRAESASSSLSRGHAKRPSAVKEQTRHPEAAIYRGAIECPICFLVRPRVCLLALNHFPQEGFIVLSTQYQSLALLRPGDLHRVLCSNQESGSHRDSPRFGARRVSLLCSRELWDRIHASNLAGGSWKRRSGKYCQCLLCYVSANAFFLAEHFTDATFLA